MPALTTIFAGVAAAAAAGGAAVSAYQGQNAATAQRHALDQQKRAQAESVAMAKSQQRESEQAQAMANRREPDVASIMAAAAKEGGNSGTMLTGPTGSSPAQAAHGRTSLLGG